MVSITRFSPAIVTRPVPTSSNNRGCDSTAVAAFSTLVRAVIVATPSALATSTGTDRPASSPDNPIWGVLGHPQCLQRRQLTHLRGLRGLGQSLQRGDLGDQSVSSGRQPNRAQ